MTAKPKTRKQIIKDMEISALYCAMGILALMAVGSFVPQAWVNILVGIAAMTIIGIIGIGYLSKQLVSAKQ